MTLFKGNKIQKLLIILLSLSVITALGVTIISAATAWAPNTYYAVGAVVTYSGTDYQCLQAHTSQVGWEPPNVPALWSPVGPGATPTNTPTSTSTPAQSPTLTNTNTPTTGGTPTATNTNTPTSTPAQSSTPTNTNTPTTGVTPTATNTNTPTSTPAQSPTPTNTNTPTPSSASPTPTNTPTQTPVVSSTATIPSRVIVGYWHNFDNGSGVIRLRDVSTKFDVINVAFGEPTTASSGIIQFAPFNATDTEFTSDVAYLHSIGKKVMLSIGGANGMVQLGDTTARDNFVSTVTALMNKYGFDGIDIDFEAGSLTLNSGDTDYKNPTTPVIVNLISAIRSLSNQFGSRFMLTMAPETFYVQMGYYTYGGSGGAYLPVIYALRDILNWLQVQYYNSGPIMSLDDQWRNMGNADFIVAMADMTLQGFPLNHNQNNFFPALRPDQIVIGLPACNYAGNGFVTAAEVQKALDYIIKGSSFGGSYVLRNPAGYPGLRGLMTWSINWDAYTNFVFSTSHRAYLDSL